VPGLDGEPLSPWALALLLHNPAEFFVAQVLGVRRLRPLYGSSRELDKSWREQQLLRALQAVSAGPRDAGDAILGAWDADVEAWARFRVDVSPEALRAARAITQQTVEPVLSRLPRGTTEPVQGCVAPHLPWVVEAEIGWVDGDTLAQVQKKKPAKGKLVRDAADVVLAALVHPAVARIVVMDATGKAAADTVDAAASQLLPALEAVTDSVRAGWWPTVKRVSAVHLSTDPIHELEEGAP